MVMLHKQANKSSVIATVTVALANALVIKASYCTKNIRPDQAVIRYQYRGGGIWTPIEFYMHGPNVKKDGTEGQTRHKWDSPLYERARDKEWEDLSLPQRWERMLTEQYMPVGTVVLDPSTEQAADIALLHPEVRP